MLPERTVAIWTAQREAWRNASAWQRLEGVLDKAEKERSHAFRFAVDREIYTLAHGMLRFVLSRYRGDAPESWRFCEGPQGRPELADAEAAGHLRFSLTHTKESCAVAVALQAAVGIDLESFERTETNIDLVAQSLSHAERDAVAIRAGPDQRRRFFEIWTLKEAFLKARGTGLAEDLNSFSFSWQDRQQIHFTANPALGEDAYDWTFWLRNDLAEHALAVAVRSSGQHWTLASSRFLPSTLAEAD